MKSCVFIGRFQPFHNGHLMVIKGMAKVCQRVVIVIGSAQESGTDQNPYTAEQRKDMIQRTLQTEDLIPKYDIDLRQVDDCEDDGEWAEKVCKQCGEIGTVWTGDNLVKKCFEEKGVEVKEIKEVPGISGTDIRAKMAAGDESWKDQVPVDVKINIGN
tara:strand:- start:97 stop:570 length:474 start_codon:yes stop_codon:yes gene_type:complete